METRKRIVEAAARLFRARGYDGVGVDAIMSEAGLTAGGFYAHFPSKEALFNEAMATALGGGAALQAAKAQSDAVESLRILINSYLSRQHRDMVADGCLLPALTPDVARGSADTRAGYERQIRQYLAEIAALLPDAETPASERAMALLAECVGGLMLARAVGDEAFSNQILKACRKAAMKVGKDEP